MITGRFAGRQVTIAPGTSHAVDFDLRQQAAIGFIPGHASAVLHDFGSDGRTLLISPEDFANPVRFGDERVFFQRMADSGPSPRLRGFFKYGESRHSKAREVKDTPYPRKAAMNPS